MDESRFLSLLRKARNHSYLGGSPDYWHGYQRGLRRGFLDEMFGTDDEHKHWMRLADDGSDKVSRERGQILLVPLLAAGLQFHQRIK